MKDWKQQFDKEFDHFNPRNEVGFCVPITGDDYENIISFVSQLLEEARKEGQEEAITYISQKQGWEETEDNYRERFGFPPKYSSL